MTDQHDTPQKQSTAEPDRGPSVQGALEWLDLMGACHQLVLAGLRREIGPEGDVRAAYRRWYAEQMEEHDRMMLTMMKNFARCGDDHAS